jgi:hypothetical protein
MNQLVVERRTDIKLGTQNLELSDPGTRWVGKANACLSDMLSNVSKLYDVLPVTQSLADAVSWYESPNSANQLLADTDSYNESPIVEEIENVVINYPQLKNLKIGEESVTDKFIALNEWEGIVMAINRDDKTFTARLIDVNEKKQQAEEGDFLIDDIRNDDMKLLCEGAIFRWIVGYEIKRRGEKRRSSQIVFRRLPQWTKREIEEADKEAKKVMGSINWE